MPICLNFLSSGNSQAYIESESGHDILVYDETYIITDEVDSETAWNCLCGTFPPPCNCEIDFEFSDDPDDFFPSAGSTIGLARWNYFSYSCLLRCSKSKIYINNTREFTGSAPSNPAKKYAYHINNGILASDPGLIDQLPPYATVYNLTNLLTHELGHILGLGHHTKTDGSKACPEESNGIMNATTAGNDYKENLSTDDICAFKKLHCPGLVGVDDHQFLSSGPN
ncbi:MAG: matrixin family metalloprotease [Candidatus Kapaibacterium sp.]